MRPACLFAAVGLVAMIGAHSAQAQYYGWGYPPPMPPPYVYGYGYGWRYGYDPPPYAVLRPYERAPMVLHRRRPTRLVVRHRAIVRHKRVQAGHRGLVNPLLGPLPDR